MKTCKYCNKQFITNHYCTAVQEDVDYDDDSNFMLSALVAMETDNAILGAMAGGDIGGAILGEVIADTFSSSSDSW